LISSRIGHSLDPLLIGTYRLLFGRRAVSPNILTVFGLFFSLLASALAASRWPLFLAGVFLVIAGFFDLLDGAVARNTKMMTPFGGFLDSVIDRYSDLLIMLGIAIHFLREEEPDPLFAMIAFFAAIGTAIIPYARARAEAASIECRNGLLERSERIMLLLAGLFFNILRPVVVIFAVFTHLTVLQRVILTRRAAQRQAGGGDG
jgi:phosphatidylglycerophosphate synthase